MTIEQLINLIAWLTILPYLYFCILYYRNRYVHPIKGRYPRAASLEILALFSMATANCFNIVVPLSCEAFEVIQYLTPILAEDFFAYRLIQLLFNYEITKSISELKEKKNLLNWKPNWFARNRWLAQDKFMFRFFAFLLSISFLVIVAVESTGGFCASKTFTLLIVDTHPIVFCLLALFIAYRMWNYPPDAFGIKAEFKFLVFGILLTLLFALVLGIAFRNFSWILHPLVSIGMHPTGFVTLVLPWWESRHYLLHSKDKKKVVSLASWLSFPEGVKSFLAYLQLEFSSENLLFYLSVIHLRSLSSSDVSGIKTEVLQIYHQFFDLSSPCPVNVAAGVSDEINKRVHELEETSAENLPQIPLENLLSIFDRAKKEVYLLMNSDPFYRFQQTAEFETLYKQHDENDRKKFEAESEHHSSPLVGDIESSMGHSRREDSPLMAKGDEEGRAASNPTSQQELSIWNPFTAGTPPTSPSSKEGLIAIVEL